jgi:hypothetical protein
MITMQSHTNDPKWGMPSPPHTSGVCPPHTQVGNVPPHTTSLWQQHRGCDLVPLLPIDPEACPGVEVPHPQLPIIVAGD